MSAPATAGPSIDEILARLDIRPEDDSAVGDAEARYLHELVVRLAPTATLEVGCGLGKSAAAIMAATTGRHIVIDPFQDNYDRRGISNIERAGFGERLDFIAEPSHVALPRLLAEGRRFDFVFIDGSHRFDDIFVDFYYADHLLTPGGVVVFDDLWMRTARLVLAFIRTNRPDYTEVPDVPRTFATVRKTGVDERNGMFHREFYTPRSLVSHNANLWITTGPDTRLKAALRRLKGLVYR
ncbi:MAG TPA: class I SAM-dependent methyltransferase [Solirubrobacteraceae bacterium]|jgi:predicted O-methyltransferase YrrM|nr:class I SAM-dependent methyltransferase [Solirubrobacteraceae bacterium]